MRLLLLFISFGCLIFSFVQKSQAQDADIDTLRANHFENSYRSSFFRDRYQVYTLEHFLDNYYPNGHYQIETTGNFSQPDDYVFSLTGSSYKWNKFYYDGIRINDLSFPGASLHKPMLFNKNLNIDLINTRLDFSSSNSSEPFVFGQWNHGSLGDKVPWSNAYIHLMHGHKSGPEKAWQPIPNRRKTKNQGVVYFSLPSEKHDTYGYLTSGTRMITNFNFIEMDDYYGEDYFQFHVHSDINIKNQKLDYLITYSQRSDFFSEFYFGNQETSSLQKLNASLYAKNKKLGSNDLPFIYNAGLNLSLKSIKKNQPNFRRNVVDQDGESLEPFYSDGRFTDLMLSFNAKKKLAQNLNLKIDTYNGLVHFSPRQNQYHNALFYENNLTPFQSLYVTEWESEAFGSGILENTVGLNYQKKSSDNRFNVDLTANLTYDGIYFSPGSITSVNYELGIELRKKHGSNAQSKFQLGKRRVPYEFEQVKFLSNKYQSGIASYWTDINGNESFESSEKGQLLKTTGGQYHHASDELKQPEIYYMDYSFLWKMGKNWQLTALAQYRKFANQWTVEYDQDASTLGQFVTNSEGKEIFYLDGGVPTSYNVVPFNQQVFEQLAQKKLGWFFNSPFYGGFTLNVEKTNRKSYFYISATAYAVVGLSPMGNGVLTNNLGVMSESLANPNTYIENLGRLDSDRAYIIRFYYQRQLGKNWNLGFQMKYKDGQSVNRNEFELLNRPEGTQFAFWNIDIKGINPFTGQFGIREAGIWNYELRLQHSFEIAGKKATANLNIYNIMDVSSPLNNYNFPEPDGQYSLEYQIPRGFTLSLQYFPW